MSAPQRLPTEVIFHIIDSVIDNPHGFYSPADDVTKTLLSFTRVCRATYTHASNLLRRQCMHINTERRLRLCVDYLNATKHRVPEYNAVASDNLKADSLTSRLCPITSLYFSPFETDNSCVRAHLERSAHQMVELFDVVRPALKRLILDLDLFDFADVLFADAFGFDFNRRPALEDREPEPNFRDLFFTALSSLTELESLVDLGGNYRFRMPRSPTELRAGNPTRKELWTCWPNLHRLALYLTTFLESHFWRDVREADQLDTLILSGSYSAFSRPKSGYFNVASDGTQAAEPPRPLRVVYAEQARSLPKNDTGRRTLPEMSDWPSIDPNNVMQIFQHEIPPSVRTREFFRTAAIRGEIWDWEDVPIS